MFRKDFMKKTNPAAVIFMSGAGTNAEKLLESAYYGKSWHCSVLVTDRPERSRAAEIAARFGIPCLEHDIFRFYRDHGMQTIGIGTEQGFAVRQLWTDALREKLKDYACDFGLLAGFIPLTNLVGDFPCLNVHPGDLTYEKNGKRILTGLHALPVERAIAEGLDYLRSSVILATPFTPGAKEMDGGHILGISGKIPLLPRESAVSDEDFVKKNLENLKKAGDWSLFPSVVNDFASGRFSTDEAGELLWNDTFRWRKVRTVEYLEHSKQAVER